MSFTGKLLITDINLSFSVPKGLKQACVVTPFLLLSVGTLTVLHTLLCTVLYTKAAERGKGQID